MKLQHKLALYNSFTKFAIIGVLTLLIILFIDRISLNHLKQRIIDKRDKLVKNLSEQEIEDLLNRQKSFTDYNILKEEYIILDKTSAIKLPANPLTFDTSMKEIEGDQEEYLVLTNYFRYRGYIYRLEIGETMLVVQQIERTILFFTLLMLVLSLSLSLISDLAFTQYLLAPFYQIIDKKLHKVNDPLHFNYEVVKTTTEDFQFLDSSINLLMKKISDLFITEKQFISNVSHELLTPISVLRNRFENILNDETLSDENQNKINASLKTLSRIKGVINSLLLISKVENNQFHKDKIVSINAIMDDIYEELEDRIAAKHIIYINELSQNFDIIGNKDLIHTLCINLVNNGIKYNRTGGRLTISDSITDSFYTLLIEDEGLGMDIEQIDHAFRRFEKLNSTDNESQGLGLAIAKSIAVFHKINLSINSQKNTGTIVKLEFPR